MSRFESDNMRFDLINELTSARNHLLTVGTFLVEEAIGEGDPSRDITKKDEYIQAQERLAVAEKAIAEFAISSS